VQLADWQDEFAALGVEVAAITYDPVATQRQFAEASGIDYPLLSDTDVASVRAFDVLNDDYEPGHRAYGIPYPGVFFIDRKGIIAAKFAVPGYRERPPLAVIEAELRQILGSSAQAAH
jgi:peroxiredoxin